jgi:hypothetical protein
MKREELARLLAAANEVERAELLACHAPLADVDLAWALKVFYEDSRNSDPEQAAGASAALTGLAHTIHNPEIAALADWTAGMAALHLEGQIELAPGSIRQ